MFLLMASACVDNAKADYDRCMERQRAYDVPGAYSACTNAVAADPKSVSGQAAAQELDNLKPVVDKMERERAERDARDKAIKKDEPAPPPPTATVAAPPPWDGGVGGPFYTQAQALYSGGDLAGARAILEPRAVSGKSATDEVGLLKTICKAQKDKVCITLLGRKYH
jgi:hypothetical protein